MKKNFALLMALIAVSQLAYGHECDDPNCPFHGTNNHVVETDVVEDEEVHFEKFYFNSDYNTNISKYAFGREDLGKFLSYPSIGYFNINTASKINEHHKIDFAYKSQLNLVPYIYDYSVAMKKLKKDRDNTEKALKNIKLFKEKIRKENQDKTEAQIQAIINAEVQGADEMFANFLKLYPKQLSELEQKHLKSRPQDLVKFESAHIGYEYNHDDKAKVYFKLAIADETINKPYNKRFLSFRINPTYEFKDYFKDSQTIKVKSLKLTPSYEFKIQTNTSSIKRDQIVNLGFKSQLELPYGFIFNTDLSKFVVARFNYDNELKQEKQHNTYINGEINLSLSKNFELYKDEKHELNLSNKTSWSAIWAWNEKGKTIIDKERQVHVYKNKFLNDELKNETKLAYDYKITDSLTLASQLAFKYEAIYNRDRTINEVTEVKDAKRVHTFKPTAQVGLHYDKKLNDKVNVYSNLDFEFSTEKEENKERAYFIEPKFKLGFKYIY